MNYAIVEDESNLEESLRITIENNFPQLNHVFSSSSVNETINQLKIHNDIDFLFLDIVLEDGNVFKALEEATGLKAQLIFTTAYNEHALKAIKFSALDYIMKPISEELLVEAIQRGMDKIGSGNEIAALKEQVEILKNIYQDKSQKKMAIRSKKGVDIVNICDIVYIQADSSYSVFKFVSGKKIMVSKPLKEYEEFLSGFKFLRPHHGYIVNPDFITRYLNEDGGVLVLNDEINIPISRRKRESVLNVINNIS